MPQGEQKQLKWFTKLVKDMARTRQGEGDEEAEFQEKEGRIIRGGGQR